MVPQNATDVDSARNSRRAWRCFLVSTVVALVSIDVSSATWSTRQHPSDAYHSSRNFSQKPNAIFMNGDTLRGGSTKMQPPAPSPPQQSYQEHHQESELVHHQHRSPQRHEGKPFIPKISLEQVANALLHTSEWNRRLLQGVKHWGRHRKKILSSPDHYYIEHQKQHPHMDRSVHHAQQNMYGNIPVNVHPSRTWHPPIQASSGRFLEEEELSLFHAKKPRSQSLSVSKVDEFEEEDTKGVNHWGPDLFPYLLHIADLLGIDEDGVEICLAMIYLDRACSVETPRSNGVPSCPFCSPRTVHRLSLAALLVSMEAVRGEPQQFHIKEDDYMTRLSQSLGIPLFQLQQMVDWMRAAQGDEGLYVTLEEMKRWSRSWESILSKT